MDRILLCGAMGKMGREVVNCAGEYGFGIAAGVDACGAQEASLIRRSSFSP